MQKTTKIDHIIGIIVIERKLMVTCGQNRKGELRYGNLYWFGYLSNQENTIWLRKQVGLVRILLNTTVYLVLSNRTG